MFPGVKSHSIYARLPTEQNNPRSRQIDRFSVGKALRTINNEDATVARAVRAQIPQIEKAVHVLLFAVKSGGRIFILGAGTSGRLAVLEAAECPPTFNTPPSLIQAVMAGGKSSVFRSKEGAEDRGADAERFVRGKVRDKDVVIGVAASGITPFVQAGLAAARKRGAKTVLVTCHSGQLMSPAHVTIAVKTGPEVISGSTRLKAGTATKLVLNMLTVGTMIQLGKVYGNRMVDLQPRSAKLTARATRLISELAGVPSSKAAKLLRASGGNAKVAVLMAKKKIGRAEAVQQLADVNGHLHAALTE